MILKIYERWWFLIIFKCIQLPSCCFNRSPVTFLWFITLCLLLRQLMSAATCRSLAALRILTSTRTTLTNYNIHHLIDKNTNRKIFSLMSILDYPLNKWIWIHSSLIVRSGKSYLPVKRDPGSSPRVKPPPDSKPHPLQYFEQKNPVMRSRRTVQIAGPVEKTPRSAVSASYNETE